MVEQFLNQNLKIGSTMKAFTRLFRQLVDQFVLYRLHSFYSALKSDQTGQPTT
ncbi:hypothetical protein AHMF7616_03961 [Adhaeribacter pallidiroseus]|uniref:Uncharacterized protein n=1 Tax=Adhaeribacter pallidiroseus TaxID=2072847 RepID=A0A369QK96_9BACT|nr:hypothetical protein AHMF7616_03961 [Adhaeribacter pallidiroseus]